MPGQIIKTLSAARKRRSTNKIRKRKPLKAIIEENRILDIKKASFKNRLEDIQKEIELPPKSEAAQRIAALRKQLKICQSEKNDESNCDKQNSVTISGKIQFSFVLLKK